MEARHAIHLTATGTVHAGHGSLVGAVLAAGASEGASAVLRTGGESGAILCTLRAPTGRTATFQPSFVLGYHALHLTLTGADAVCTVHV